MKVKEVMTPNAKTMMEKTEKVELARGELEITMPMLKAELTTRKIEINEPPPQKSVKAATA